ncbi:hypothetical protein FZI95_02720 [Mycobacterium sp. CBMA247]|nr:hypothetical protein [Mycolicibacterium sp. CBMA 329]MUL86470.1 hypothetical protein [Mycolicibacterium sp. CBMA 331]MUM01332.1 hypothetical protein [Mycolicibacterium sp. CBMA 334]MUM25842.1 hypothetical protein [Mycolicibacterium sp. CBMA 295]MUM36766.1 hypothetical protein [Mycolicibacterium sp. CBMA 247]MUM42534.1 hypothetical protein [Mycolicibacterium sp. CBMA 294]
MPPRALDRAGIACRGRRCPAWSGRWSAEVWLSLAQRLWERGQKNGRGSPPPHLVTTKGQ